MDERLITNNMLFIIPSWGALLGYPTLGKYVSQDISKIHSDFVIFLTGIECSTTVEKGTVYYLFGLGYYYSKFELQLGKYIIDTKPLTGLILTDFVYDLMASSKNITLENDRDVIIGDNVIKVPINLSHKSETQKTFIKGTLMRNLFIPNKDIVLDLMNEISKLDAYQLEKNGHILLSTHWDFYNKILISKKMNDIKVRNYINARAGLDDIIFGADELLKEKFSLLELQKIGENISNLKKIYSTLEYDPVLLFSILENASKVLISRIPQFSKDRDIEIAKKMPKESIFISAESRLNSFIGWPDQIKRKVVEKVDLAAEYKKKYLEFMKSSTIDGTEISKIDKQVEDVEEKYELRLKKSRKVESKPLPKPPEGNIVEILLYLKKIIEEDFEMQAIGKAFELARDNLRKIILQSDYMWEMSKYANIYQKKKPNLSLSLRDKEEIIKKVDGWIFEIQEEKRKEQERLERERLEKFERERMEKERLERERLEKIERERLEQERLERERLEKLERERLEQERLEKERIENERLEQERLEKERIEQESLEKERLETKRFEEVRLKREELEQTRREIEQIKQERKEKQKEWKIQRKKEKKLKKEKYKLEKKKRKEEQKLRKIQI